MAFRCRFTVREGRRKMWSTLPIYTVKKVGVRWPKHPFRLHLVRVKCPHLRILRLQSRFPACRTSRARRRSCAGCSTAATGWTSSTAARVKRSCFGRPVPQEPPPLCKGRAKKINKSQCMPEIQPFLKRNIFLEINSTNCTSDST